jgi:hypothetical protein
MPRPPGGPTVVCGGGVVGVVDVVVGSRGECMAKSSDADLLAAPLVDPI